MIKCIVVLMVMTYQSSVYPHQNMSYNGYVYSAKVTLGANAIPFNLDLDMAFNVYTLLVLHHPKRYVRHMQHYHQI